MKPTSRAVMEEANTVGALGRGLACSVPRMAPRRAARCAPGTLRWWFQTSGQACSVGRRASNSWDCSTSPCSGPSPRSKRAPRDRRPGCRRFFWRTNELLKQRRTRLDSAQAEVLGTLWAVVLIGATLSMFTAYVLPPTRFHGAMISSTATDRVRTAVSQCASSGTAVALSVRYGQ